MVSNAKRRGRPKRFNEDDKQYTIQALDRALCVLGLLSNRDRATVAQLAEELDQSTTTVYRILQNLEAHSLVMFEQGSQTWSVGAQAVALSSSYLRSNSFMQTSQRLLHDLMELTNETTSLALVNNNRDVILICQVAAKQTTRANFSVGYQLPVHASGIGKAALAGFSVDEARTILSAKELTQFTDKTITEKDALMNELEAIRDRGFSIDDEEVTIGMRCLAVPVQNSVGKIAAGLSVSGPAHRLSQERYDEIAQHLQDVAQRLAADIEAREFSGIGLSGG